MSDLVDPIDDEAPHPTVTVQIAVTDPQLRPKVEWVFRTLLSAFDASIVILSDSDTAADIGYGCTGRVHTYTHHQSDWCFGRTPPEIDQIARAFWWLARQEEQLADSAADQDAFDDHRRFRYDASHLAQLSKGDEFAVIAPVDDIAADLGRHLGLAYRSWSRKHANFAIVLTHDIDIPRRWDRIGIRRGLGDVKRQIRRLDLTMALGTIISLLAIPIWWLRRGDPYTNARRIGKLEAKYHTRSTSFVIADHQHPADGSSSTYRSAIGRYSRDVIATGGELGLHGSYTASTEQALRAEYAQLPQITGQDIHPHHRFHYLRHDPLVAWPQLDRAGLATDASLGYAEMPGFRSGWSRPYHAWSHEENRPLDLIVIPLAFMDATLEARYLNISPKHAAPILDAFVAHAHQHHSCFSVLWHNDKLRTGGARQYTKLYKHLLRRVVYHGGASCAVSDFVDA